MEKYLESFEKCCWRKMEKICWSDHLKYKDVLQRVKEDRNILQTIKRRKADWISNISRGNCTLKHVIKGNIEERVEMKRRQQKKT
jgi:hypothetical protein